MSDRDLLDKLLTLSNDSKTKDQPIMIDQFPKKKLPDQNASKITKISAQKTSGRYNIFINHRFAFGISEDLLVEYNLHKGMEISPDLIERLHQEERIQKAYHQALNYLGYRQRSVEEVKDYLTKKAYDTEIDFVIDKLKRVKLLDDQEFADAYVRTAVNEGKKGPEKIERELKQKGVNLNRINQSLDNFYSREQQIDHALQLAEKKWDSLHRYSRREAYQKVNQYLLQRGFNSEIIRQVDSLFKPEMDKEEEYSHLKKVADKAWRRYSKKETGYDRDQKVRAYLYRKQYPKELIEYYITERKEAEDG